MNSHPASMRSFFKFHEFYILSQRAHVFLKFRTGLLQITHQRRENRIIFKTSLKLSSLIEVLVQIRHLMNQYFELKCRS